jgi:hypothetical protein
MNSVKRVVLKDNLSLTSLRIIGISSHDNDYRVSWAINNQIGLNFSKSDNLDIRTVGAQLPNSFTSFAFFDIKTGYLFRLISNRCPGGFLSKDYRTIDYFLVIEGDVDPMHVHELVCQLKGVEIIHTAFVIDPASFGKKLLPVIATLAA